MVFQFESMVWEIAFFVLLAVKVFAFVDALVRPTQAYVASSTRSRGSGFTAASG